jgi:uncharacterized protein
MPTPEAQRTADSPRLFLPTILCLLLLLGCAQKSDRRPDPQRLLFDFAGIVEEAEKLDQILGDYRDRFGVELVVATGAGAAFEDINTHAQTLFSDWRVGARFGGRGLLLLIDAERGEGRLEVSYALEHVFTDFLCGRIVRDQVRPFWEMDMIYVGMLDAVFQIGERSKLLALDRDVAADRARAEDRYLSGGGGVTAPIDFGAGREPKQRLSPALREAYRPGETPQAVLARFADAMARGVNDNTLGMYTPATQVFFAMEPTLTREYRTYADIIRNGAPYTVTADGQRAVVRLRPGLPGRMPVFCRKSPSGWRIDWVTLFASHGKSLEGEWIMHRVPTGYEHLIAGVEGVGRWATRLPFVVDQRVDFRRQVEQAEAALQNAPREPPCCVRLAHLYLACWRWPDALRLYARAAALAPEDPAYVAHLAEAKYYLYFLESARKNFRQLQADPQWRGLAVRRLKQIERLLSG